MIGSDRRSFIGSSDIAAIMGLSRWSSPLQLWAEKTGRVEPDDLSEVEYVQLGTELEEFVAQKFSKKTGLTVRRSPKIYVHKDRPHFRAQVDRLIEGTKELLECKTCSARKLKEWDGEEIPIEYILQVMWQLGITGREVGHIAVLIGGQAFKYKRIDFDQELFDKMISQAGQFWHMVQTDTPPMASGMDNAFMVELYPKNDEQMQQIDELNDKISLLQQIKGNLDGMFKQKDTIEAELKAVIGDTLGIKTPEYTVTWKRQVKKEYTVKASETRVLRIRKDNENVNSTADKRIG